MRPLSRPCRCSSGIWNGDVNSSRASGKNFISEGWRKASVKRYACWRKTRRHHLHEPISIWNTQSQSFFLSHHYRCSPPDGCESVSSLFSNHTHTHLEDYKNLTEQNMCGKKNNERLLLYHCSKDGREIFIHHQRKIFLKILHIGWLNHWLKVHYGKWFCFFVKNSLTCMNAFKKASIAEVDLINDLPFQPLPQIKEKLRWMCCSCDSCRKSAVSLRKWNIRRHRNKQTKIFFI